MIKNDGKFMKKCFQLLFKKLRHLQHELNSKFRIDKFFHNKLINACQNISICQYACFKSSNNLVNLINDLRSFIVTYHKINLNTKTFFVDKRYHNDSNSSRHEQQNSRYSRSSYKNKNNERRHEDKRTPYENKQKKNVLYVIKKIVDSLNTHEMNEKSQKENTKNVLKINLINVLIKEFLNTLLITKAMKITRTTTTPNVTPMKKK